MVVSDVHVIQFALHLAQCQSKGMSDHDLEYQQHLPIFIFVIFYTNEVAFPGTKYHVPKVGVSLEFKLPPRLTPGPCWTIFSVSSRGSRHSWTSLANVNRNDARVW